MWNWTVSGAGHVYLISPSSLRLRPKYEDGLRLTFGPMNVHRLDVGTYKVADVLQGAATYQVKVSKGTVFATDNGGSLY